MKKKWLILVGVLVILTIIIVLITKSSNGFKDVSNDDFTFTYDSTWRVISKKQRITLQHKKTKSKLNIQCLVLDDTYLDTSLQDILPDIIYGIEEQNKDYKLINTFDSPSTVYDSYSYLYEDDMDQALVNIYKKDNKVVIAYYSADSEVFDILLDSVDEIFNSIEIKVGEEIELT